MIDVWEILIPFSSFSNITFVKHYAEVKIIIV